MRKICSGLALFMLGLIVYASKNDVKDIEKFKFLPESVCSVNGVEYSKSDFIDFYESTYSSKEREDTTSEAIKRNISELMKRYVNSIIFSKLAAKAGYKPSPEAFIKDYDEDMKKMSKNEIDAFKMFLKSKNSSYEKYRKELSENKVLQRLAAVELWTQSDIMPKIKVTEEEVKKFYDKNSEMVSVSQIFIKPSSGSVKDKTTARNRAEKILKRINNGEDFNTLAKKEGSLPIDIGELCRGQMVKEFDVVAFRLKPGEISEVIETPSGYHIIMVKERKKRKNMPPFDRVKKFFENQLKEIKLQDVMLKKLAEAEKHIKVKVFVK